MSVQVQWYGNTIKALIKQAVTEGLDDGAQMIKEAAKELAPVDTGALRDSIDVEVLDEHTRAVGSDLDYAKFVELGTEKMAAEPYLRPALRAVRDEILRKFEDKI